MIDLPGTLQRNRAELQATRQQLRQTLADAWLAEIPQVAQRLLNDAELLDHAQARREVEFGGIDAQAFCNDQVGIGQCSPQGILICDEGQPRRIEARCGVPDLRQPGGEIRLVMSDEIAPRGYPRHLRPGVEDDPEQAKDAVFLDDDMRRHAGRRAWRGALITEPSGSCP